MRKTTRSRSATVRASTPPDFSSSEKATAYQLLGVGKVLCACVIDVPSSARDWTFRGGVITDAVHGKASLSFHKGSTLAPDLRGGGQVIPYERERSGAGRARAAGCVPNRYVAAPSRRGHRRAENGPAGYGVTRARYPPPWDRADMAHRRKGQQEHRQQLDAASDKSAPRAPISSPSTPPSAMPIRRRRR